MYDLLVKINLVGETCVGKTSLMDRYCQTCFCCRNTPTIGLDFKIRTIQVDEKKVKVQIWDVAGQERFRTITRVHYKGAMGMVLCYAINCRESFEKIEFLMEDIRKYASEDVCIVLVGTKSDLSDERVVSIDEGRKLAESYGIKFCENSAKNNFNVDEVFLGLTKDIMKVLEKKTDPSGKLLKLGKTNSEVKDGGPRCF